MVRALVLVPVPHSLSKMKEAEGKNGTDIKSKITAHTHSPIYENVGMGWMAFCSLPPTTDTGRWEEEDQGRELASLSLASLWQEGKEEGQGHLSVGVNQGVQKKINTNAKEIFRCAKERERAWGGWLVVLRGLWAPTPLALPTGSRLRLAARF